MKAPERNRSRSRRGSALVLLAAALAVILSVSALSIDLGALRGARIEAQRAADAAALAGSSAFAGDGDQADSAATAHDRAVEFALRNAILNRPIDSSEVAVTVKPESALVRVVIRRRAVATWFARLLGRDSVAVSARAAAITGPATLARCVKPFAVPDLWHDEDDDKNGNRFWDEGEQWMFGDDPLDYYRSYDGIDAGWPPPTGYGSLYRGPDRDYGRRVRLKLADPKVAPAPSIFYPVALPTDPSLTCGSGGSGGASSYRANICGCNGNGIDTSQEYQLLTGNMTGPTTDGIEELLAQDPDAYWDEASGQILGSRHPDWWNSPRVVRIGLYDPAVFAGGGRNTVRFHRFAWMFVEDQTSKKHDVVGRYLRIYKTTRLVE